MKFKVLKGTALYEKFMQLQKRIGECHDAAMEMANEFDCHEWHEAYFSLRGGITGFVIPGGKPEGWANAFIPHEKDTYMPKKSKANKAMWDRINSLPKVGFDELNSIVNYDSDKHGRVGRTVSYTPRLYYRKEVVLLSFGEGSKKYKPVDGMIEITVSEYNKLVGEDA